MLILFFILLIFSAIAGAALIAKSLKGLNKSEKSEPDAIASGFRPLFAPTEEDLRAFESEQAAELAAARDEDERHARVRLAEEFEERLTAIELDPSRQLLIEIISDAAAAGDGEVFERTALRILRSLGRNRTNLISRAEFADLLESRLMILPQQERTPGMVFRLREEIEELRSASEDIS